MGFVKSTIKMSEKEYLLNAITVLTTCINSLVGTGKQSEMDVV